MTARERLGVRVLQWRGELAGHRPWVRWMMAVGVVVRGMTACLTVAAAAVVVDMLLLVVAVAVDGVVLSLLRFFIRLHSLLHVKSQLGSRNRSIGCAERYSSIKTDEVKSRILTAFFRGPLCCPFQHPRE